MGNFQKYRSQNVGQDFIVLDFFVGGILCGRKRCVREINVSRAWDPVYAGDKRLLRGRLRRKGGGLTGMLLLQYFLDKYINHYSVLIIFTTFFCHTFPQPHWFRSTQHFIFTLRFIIFFTNKLWWYLQIKQTGSTDFKMGLKITQSVIYIFRIYIKFTGKYIYIYLYILFITYFPDGSGDLLISVGNNMTYLSIKYYPD